jgi:hypothetical protein
MDPDTVRCAINLQKLLCQKHDYARNIDLCTRKLITLICQSTANPHTNSEPYRPTKEAFQQDLNTLAEALFQQANRPACQPVDLSAIHATVVSAIDQCFTPKAITKIPIATTSTTSLRRL